MNSVNAKCPITIKAFELWESSIIAEGLEESRQCTQLFQASNFIASKPYHLIGEVLVRKRSFVGRGAEFGFPQPTKSDLMELGLVFMRWTKVFSGASGVACRIVKCAQRATVANGG